MTRINSEIEVQDSINSLAPQWESGFAYGRSEACSLAPGGRGLGRGGDDCERCRLTRGAEKPSRGQDLSPRPFVGEGGRRTGEGSHPDKIAQQVRDDSLAPQWESGFVYGRNEACSRAPRGRGLGRGGKAAFTLAEGATHVANRKNSRQAAFTLAEVLITLGIIGVVAAMTLPSLIANYKKQQYVNSLKVGYSILNNGFRTMMAEEGVDDIEDTELFAATKSVGADTDTVASEQAAAKVMEKYFQKVRFVSRADLLGKSSCEDLVGKGPRFWNLGDKSQCSGNYNMQYALPNGMTMSIYFYDECAKSSLSDTEIAAAGGKMTKWCGMIDLDINGEKGPNQWGRDGFRFVVSQSAVVPFLGKDYNIFNGNTIEQSKDVIKTHCNPKSQTSTGRSCAARIMELDDWKMKY